MDASIPEVVLVITVGAQDIKIWCNDHETGSITSIKPDTPIHKQHKANTERETLKGPRPFHDYLLSNNSRYCFYDTKAQVPASQCLTKDELENQFNSALDISHFTTPQAGYPLHPAKLAFVVKDILAEQAAGKLKVVRALVFATDRRDVKHCKFSSSEPIAAGPLIARWLADRFELEYTGQQQGTQHYASWVNCLEGLTDFSGNLIEDKPVERQACNYILQALKTARQGLMTPSAVLSDTGGMTEVKQVINAATRLHFGHQVHEVRDSVSDNRNNTKALASPAQWNYDNSLILPTQAEILTARSHCRQRLLQGDIEGAWGSVAHLQQSNLIWLGPVKELLDYFQGKHVKSPKVKALKDLQTADASDVIRLAFKIEAALQAPQETDRRIPEALMGCVTLSDLCLKTITLQQLESHLKKISIQPLANSESPFNAINSLIDKESGTVKLTLPDAQTAGFRDFKKECYIDFSGHNGEHWRKQLRELNITSVSDFKHRLDANQISGKRKQIKPLTYYRNEFAHRSLNQQDIHTIFQQATARVSTKTHKNHHEPLWNSSTTPDQLGEHFLSMPLTQALFNDLEITDPARLYRHLLDEVLSMTLVPFTLNNQQDFL